MAGWLPFLVGYGFVALLVLGVRLFPGTWWARELSRAYEVQRTGSLGRFTHRDFYRSAAVSVGLVILLTALSFAAYALSFRYTIGAQPGIVGEVYGFTFFLVAGVALLAGVQSAVRGMRIQFATRRSRRAREADPALYAAFREVLSRHDPMKVGCIDTGEFDYQAASLLARTRRCRTFKEFVVVVDWTFREWFRVPESASSAYLTAMCQELWNARTDAGRDA